MKSLVLLFVAGALVSAAVPAPRPWPATRRLPRGTFQSDRSAFQSALSPRPLTSLTGHLSGERPACARSSGRRPSRRSAGDPTAARRSRLRWTAEPWTLALARERAEGRGHGGAAAGAVSGGVYRGSGEPTNC